jgi:hypothetical protein
MTATQRTYVATERGKFQVFIRGNRQAMRSPLAVLVQDALIGDTMLMCIELGGENLVESGRDI